MFAGGITLLCGSQMDPGNVPVSRPSDRQAHAFAQAALDAMRLELENPPLSERIADPKRYLSIRRVRRSALESFLYVEPTPEAYRRIMDLIDLICSEGGWSAESPALDDPIHPFIDPDAAETGALLAWTLRRHGAKLSEIDPRIPQILREEVRRRLLKPIIVHDDYPFLNGSGPAPALILSDLLLSCLFTLSAPSRRQPIVKLLMHRLDRVLSIPVNGLLPYRERLLDGCALADLARILKRLTRGELDYTASVPDDKHLDDLLIPWITGAYFLDPAGEGMKPDISGMDLFRLGYLTRDRALSALGAQLNRLNERASQSVSGRVLSLEYAHAVQDECSAPPHIKRAVAEDLSLMFSRCGSFWAAIINDGGRHNAGDVLLFVENTPVWVDTPAPSKIHSLPEIAGMGPLAHAQNAIHADFDFSDSRDLMSMDLTACYPEKCGLIAYQRTLMVMREEETIRLVDAFEFSEPSDLTLRFVCAFKPVLLRDRVLIGPVCLRWDGEFDVGYEECEGYHLLRFRLIAPTRRLICGFSLELS